MTAKNDFIHSSNASRKSYLMSKLSLILLIASSGSVLLSKTTSLETKDGVFLIYEANSKQIIYIIEGSDIALQRFPQK